jgi:hypothetical protein
MAKKPFTIVPSPEGVELYNLSRGPETTAERVRRLQEEAHMLAREEVESLESQLAACVQKASEIARGGEAYPAGVRELAERLSSELDGRVQTLKALVERTWKP